MSDDTWFSRDLPVLEAFAEADGKGRSLSHTDIAAATGLTDLEVAIAVDALEDAGHIRGQIVRGPFTAGAHATGMVRLTAEGRRAAGQWPTPESLAERVVTALEAAAEGELDPVKRNKAKALATALSAGGRGLLVDIAAKAISNSAKG